MKLGVGLMLTTFGTFWGAEGAGVHWPGSDLMILGVLAFYSVLAFVLSRCCGGAATRFSAGAV